MSESIINNRLVEEFRGGAALETIHISQQPKELKTVALVPMDNDRAFKLARLMQGKHINIVNILHSEEDKNPDPLIGINKVDAIVFLHNNGLKQTADNVKSFSFLSRKPKFFMVADELSISEIHEMLRYGIEAFVSEEKLVEFITNYNQWPSGFIYIDNKIIGARRHRKLCINGNLKLTKREGQVLTLLADGHSYKEISDRLGVGIDTVRTHIRRLYRKLSVHSRWQAMLNSGMIESRLSINS